MAKSLILMVIVGLMAANEASAFGRKAVTPDPEPTPPPSQEVPQIPTPVGDHPGIVKVRIEEMNDFEAADVTRLQGAVAVFEDVVNSAEFKNRVLNHSYQGVKQFVDNNGLSNEQVYNTIIAGQETFRKIPDSEANLSLNLYYTWSNVVGYTYPNTNQIFMNTKYYRVFTASQIAANMLHEWTHKLGFTHDYNSTARRPYSVPYAVGDMLEDIAAKK